MKVFLRNKNDRLYWADLSGWVAGSGQAFDFGNVPRAARFALDGRLAPMEIVLRCDVLPDEVTMPVLAEYCDGDFSQTHAA